MSSIVNPFPGIRSFDAENAAFFFGREQQIGELQEKLAANNFVAVVGYSGSGKSSLVKAGLIPTLLKSPQKKVALLRPGNNPLKNLVEALNDDEVLGLYLDKDYTAINLEYSSRGIVETFETAKFDGDLVIVIDQFEELFRFVRGNRDEALLFMNLIITAVSDPAARISVVMIMRSDFIGNCAEFKGLPELINEGQFLIPRLTRAQYKEAIVGPLKLQGISITPNLVSRFLNDIGNDPDQLPVLQHAMMLTFNHWLERSDGTLPVDVEDYDAVGGMENAIDTHCNKLFNEFDGDAQSLVMHVFQRLTENIEGVEVRRPCLMVELMALGVGKEIEVVKIVELFRSDGSNFLLPNKKLDLRDETMIDLSHECIMRKWRLLRNWIQIENDHKVQLKRLTMAQKGSKFLVSKYVTEPRKRSTSSETPTPSGFLEGQIPVVSNDLVPKNRIYLLNTDYLIHPLKDHQTFTIKDLS